ncbi:MAG: ribosomal L7Ae/L30e/S12e/Gadd45 family protein [Candidatus Parvarchaeota archaeon]|jgi:large subunit ribosomal protein L7Ae|nr:ribosomal L7Ae/L30e/S12e/Gadd45 family protein [Candidatus Parvarchaeota archaeon]MCL5017728.1 ribosomal L7Ae/L30e/S12e/Gadd45 family protein [Candidatus Parvarchaeota archaeon]
MVDEAKTEKNLDSQVYSLLEKVRAKGGSFRKGVNEVTKALERSQAKLVIYAEDVSPKEIVMHLPLLSKDKGVPIVQVKSRLDLGKAAGLSVGSAAIAIINAGEEAHALDELVSKLK